MMKHRLSDPAIDEIRKARHRISARFNHDPAQLVAYYLELQEQHREQLIETPNGAVKPSLSLPKRSSRRHGQSRAREPGAVSRGSRI
jgi:plasmid stabilization system protein ParE